jgi:hypothetical protein
MSLILSGSDGVSDIDGTAATPAIRGTDTNTGIFFGSDIIGFSEGGAEVARFNADAQFVAAAGTASLPVITTTGDVNTGIFFPAADTIAFSEGGAEAMRIDSSGNVGIGTTSPLGRLQIGGNDSALISGESNGDRSFGTNVFATISPPSIALMYGTDNSTYKNFSGLGMNFTNGDFGIVNNYQFTGGGKIVFYTGDKTSTSGNLLERLRIDAGGSLILAGSTAQKATGTTWSNPSDIRLKDNIQDYTKGLAELMQVNVKTWEYNGKGGTVPGTKGLGVIADEIQEVLPDTVDNYKAKLNNDDAENTNIKKFDATEITWLMLKSIQELKATVDAQAARIAALEAAV